MNRDKYFDEARRMLRLIYKDNKKHLHRYRVHCLLCVQYFAELQIARALGARDTSVNDAVRLAQAERIERIGDIYAGYCRGDYSTTAAISKILETIK